MKIKNLTIEPLFAARSSIVDLGTIVETGMSRVRGPMSEWYFSIYLILPAALGRGVYLGCNMKDSNVELVFRLLLLILIWTANGFYAVFKVTTHVWRNNQVVSQLKSNSYCPHLSRYHLNTEAESGLRDVMF
jgi:hypothetical protein